ncbi:MAG: phosphate acyltransferase PlsX [Brevinematales bacterium]
MENLLRIGVDIISGETDIRKLIHGCIDAVTEDPGIEVVMIGRGDIYQPVLDKYHMFNKNINRISIIEASEVITMDDDPLAVMKQKKDSSIAIGLHALKQGKIDAFFSPGNTGAIVVASALILGRVKGVKKPALASLIPNIEGKANIFLDIGASSDCEVDDLAKFAVMGKIYAEEMFGKTNPRIGLLNIGEESHKGNSTSKAVYKKLMELDINFKGNVEGYQLLSNEVDVIVSDGYIGNIALKTIEGTATLFSRLLKYSLKHHVGAFLTYPFYFGALVDLKKKSDPEQYGGAPLLGVNGNVYIGHGKSGRRAVKFGIKAAVNSVRRDILGKLHKRLSEISANGSEA